MPSVTPIPPTPPPPVEPPGGGGGTENDTDPDKPNIRFSAVAYNVTEDIGFAVITVTLEFALPGESVRVEYKTRSNTALANIDYDVITPTTLIFPPGVTRVTAVVPIKEDILNENTENLFIDLLNNSSNVDLVAGPGKDTSTLQIIDNDPLPSVRFNPSSYSKNENTGLAAINLELFPASGRNVTVFFQTENGTATAGTDYTAILSSLTGRQVFLVDSATGETANTTQTFPVNIIDDLIDEFDENLNLRITSADYAAIPGPNPITLTIVDDDPEPGLSIDNVTVTEGDTGVTNATFKISLSGPSYKPITVTYVATNSTATAGMDYTASGSTLSFAPFETEKLVNVPVLGDNTDEFTETFTVSLSNPVNATLVITNGTGTIIDDDLPARISIGDTFVTEGDSGTTTATFTLTIVGQSEKPMSVEYTTINGTAVDDGTFFSDYNAISGTLNFTLAPTTTVLSVVVNGDTMYEPNPEQFFVSLLNPINVQIADNLATGEIINDDPLPALSINNATITETTGVPETAVFTVTLSNPHYQDVTVNYNTINNSAISPGDYAAINSTLLTIPAGTLAKPITVVVVGDAITEFSETFTVTLSNALNATIAVTDGIGTIIDDDQGPVLSIAGTTITESDNGTTVPAVFTVSLSAQSEKPITVTYSTADNTAKAGTDYTSIGAATLVFAPLETNKTITVTILGDNTDEFTETFTVSLSNPVNATIALADAVGTIVDNDDPPVVSISPTLVALEGDSGGTSTAITVSLSAVSGKVVTVIYSTADNTATTGGPFSDYTPIVSNTVNFAPGESTKLIPVTINGDTILEPDESFFVNLITSTYAILGADQSAVNIINDDTQPTISIGNATVLETNTGFTSVAVFAVALSNLSYQNINVDYATVDNDAVAPGDYLAVVPTTLNFVPFQQTAQATVIIQGDDLDENDETFTASLSNPVNATIVITDAIGTILDNDAAPDLAISDAVVLETDGVAVFTITLSTVSARTITLDYATANGSAFAPGDYTGVPSTTLTFLPAETSKLISITLTNDLANEANEEFFVNLGNAPNANIIKGQGSATIQDDDPPPTVQFNSLTYNENESAGSAVLDVTLSAASGQAVTVTYATMPISGTATSGSDYTPVAATQLVFNPGETSQPITITGINDSITNEPNETVVTQLSTPVNATLGTDSVTTLTLADDDNAVVQFSDANYYVDENVGSGQAVITVTLNAESAIPVTITYVTNDGTATVADSDYALAGGTLTFNPGTLAQTFTVTIIDDSRNEIAETVGLTLTLPVNAAVGGSATLNIVNDDAAPDLSVTKVSSTATVTTSDTLTYTVSISNPGPSTATNVVLTDTTSTTGLVSYISDSGSCANSISGLDIVVVCAVGDLLPSTIDIDIVFSVVGATGSISNTADVTSTADPDTSNNTAALSVNIN